MTMTIAEAAEIIANQTGGRDSWDSEALREVAEAAIAGQEPEVRWAPEEFDGLLSAFAEIQG